jgi:hypothetical protein
VEGGDRPVGRLAAAQPDGPFDRLQAERDEPALPGRPQDDRVGRHVVAEQRLGHLLGVEVDVQLAPGPRLQRADRRADLGDVRGRVEHHGTGRDQARGDHGDGPVTVGGAQVLGVGGADQVQREVGVHAGRTGLCRTVAVTLEDQDVGDDRAALLGQTGLVEPA